MIKQFLVFVFLFLVLASCRWAVLLTQAFFLIATQNHRKKKALIDIPLEKRNQSWILFPPELEFLFLFLFFSFCFVYSGWFLILKRRVKGIHF